MTNTYIIIAVLVTALLTLFYIGHLRKEVASLKTANTKLDSALKVANGSVKSLSDAIDVQNKAIDKLKKEADERLAAGKVELGNASTRNEDRKKRATTIVKTPPDPTKSDYQAAEDAINKEILNAK